MTAPDLTRFGPELARLIAVRPDLVEAVRLLDAHAPDPAGPDDPWLRGYAEKQAADAERLYKEADDKAASVLAHLGGGVGLLSLGAVATVIQPAVPAAVAVAFLAPFLPAVGAMWFALAARRPRDVPRLPSAGGFLGSAGGPAERRIVPYLSLTARTLKHLTAARMWHVEWSLRLFVVAVTMLAVPLAVAVAAKW